MPGLLKLFLCGRLYVCTCMCVCFMCVCVPASEAINITIGVTWHDMDPMQLVKQVLQLLYDNSIC